MSSLMDRIQAKSMELNDPSSTSGIPVAAELAKEPEVIDRLRKTVDFILKDIRDNPNTSRKAKFFMDKFMKEAFLDLGEVPPEIIEEQFKRSAAAMYWVSTGFYHPDMPAPEGFWDHVGMASEAPEIPVAEIVEDAPLAIEGGPAVE